MTIGIVITVQDAKGAKSTSVVHVPTSTAFDDVMEFAEALGQNWAKLMDGQIVGVGVSYEVDISGYSDNALGANSDVEEGARFGWNTVGDFKASNRLATFLESKIVSGTKDVDLTDADVIEFRDWMISGFTATSLNTVLPCDYRAASINGLDSALENFTRSRTLRS